MVNGTNMSGVQPASLGSPDQNSLGADQESPSLSPSLFHSGVRRQDVMSLIVCQSLLRRRGVKRWTRSKVAKFVDIEILNIKQDEFHRRQKDKENTPVCDVIMLRDIWIFDADIQGENFCYDSSFSKPMISSS